jgi:hypothetical protein
MPRANAMVPPDAIRIEDEVWQEAFTRREPARPSRERKLRAIEPDPSDWLMETTGKTRDEAASWSVPRRATRDGAATRESAASTHGRTTEEPASVSVLSEPAASSAVAEPGLGTAVAEPPLVPAPIMLRPPAPAGPAARAEPLPARRTVKIQGRGAERNLPLTYDSRRRPPQRAYERTGFRPDRVAMWAVMLGFVLVLIAIISAHG